MFLELVTIKLAVKDLISFCCWQEYICQFRPHSLHKREYTTAAVPHITSQAVWCRNYHVSCYYSVAHDVNFKFEQITDLLFPDVH